jgi:Heterokaryon incompatibility protein (HET)
MCDYDDELANTNTSTTASEECFPFVQQRIDACVEGYKECIHETESAARHPLPTRLIQVQPQVRLVRGNNVSRGTPYIALSHCWGSKPIFGFKKSMLEDLFEEIPIARLPQSFQDAIQLTQKLGVSYIWIESLCIIQDSQKDWLHESFKTKDVYSNC